MFKYICPEFSRPRSSFILLSVSFSILFAELRSIKYHHFCSQPASRKSVDTSSQPIGFRDYISKQKEGCACASKK